MYEFRPNLETRTKIVATLGPASWEEPTLGMLLEAGVDVCRINGSHADPQSIRRQVHAVREAARGRGLHVGILLDLQGPKIRTSAVEAPLDLKEGDQLTVVMDPAFIGRGRTIGTTYPDMAGDVRPGTRVLFADGALAGEVTEVRFDKAPAQVLIRMTVGGQLGSHKGLNLPGVPMSVPSLTEKDKADAALGALLGVDYLALSFVRSAADVAALRDHLEGLGHKGIPILAKIEKPTAVERLAEILDAADGVMVARGDLGVEVNLERVPVYQKRIIEQAARKGKLCITATQMLDSMERNPRPTRAETTDVANAILDGTDAVMLSGETAVGRYPIDAVRTMDSIAREVEGSEFFHPTSIDQLPEATTEVLIRCACQAVADQPRPIVVFSWTGRKVLQVSKARPVSPIYAMTPNPHVADRLALAWGVTPVVIPEAHATDELIASGLATLERAGHVRKGEEVVVLAGRVASRGPINLLKIHKIGEDG